MPGLDFSILLEQLRQQKSSNKKKLISAEEFQSMLDLAETSPGMKNLLEEALAFYRLARPEVSEKKEYKILP